MFLSLFYKSCLSFMKIIYYSVGSFWQSLDVCHSNPCSKIVDFPTKLTLNTLYLVWNFQRDEFSCCCNYTTEPLAWILPQQISSVSIYKAMISKFLGYLTSLICDSIYIKHQHQEAAFFSWKMFNTDYSGFQLVGDLYNRW